MKIALIPYCFFPLLFFFSFVSIAAIAVDPGDYIFVDPKNASIKVKDLRSLLERRGLRYHGFQEKSEYVNALVESGPLTVGELKLARDSIGKSMSSNDTEELVTDLISVTFMEIFSESSEIWLVRIDPAINSMTNTLDEAVWHRLIATLSSFEVEFGQFNCKTVPNYCQTKGWNSPTLILVIPRLHSSAEHSPKAEAHLLQPSRNSLNQLIYEVDSVVKQVYSLLHEKLVRYLPSREAFDSLRTDKVTCSVHVVLLTDLRHCPFLLSALAAKFYYGSHCFGFGPKTIASDALVLPDNYVGAFFAIKSHKYYEKRWRIIPQNQSTADAKDATSNVMVTFESLSGLLQQLSPIETEKPKPPKKELPKKEPPTKEPPKKEPPKAEPPIKEPPKTEPPKKVEKPYTHTYTNSPPPIYSNSKKRPENEFNSLFWYNVIVPLLVTIGIPGIGIYVLHRGDVERRRTEELTRYRSNISSRNQSGQQNISRNVWEEEAIDMNTSQEISLLSIEDYRTVMALRVTNITDWYKKVFTRYSFHRAVSRYMLMMLAQYNIRIEEIGFPPYNWILSLPAVETYSLSEDRRQSKCLICQCSIDNSEDRLCRLPCKCKDVVYHYDCIVPWLIKREDPSSHSFISGRLHTERPCPTCRSDITTWGLRTAS
uniref:RING-type domain-containing protein n=1 Tax=Plectus sambesii TaxID=2011161 RepID=A0A914WQU4_9BILA